MTTREPIKTEPARAPRRPLGAVRAGLFASLAALASSPGRALLQGPVPAGLPPQAASIRERLARLSADDEGARTEMEALSRLGEEAALAALSDLSAVDLTGRRRRAHLVFGAGGSRCIQSAIAGLADHDAGTRGDLMAFLGRDDLGGAGLAERVEALAARTLSDPELSLRGRALELLAGLDRSEAFDRIDGMIDLLEEPLRARAAALLAEKPRAREIVERRVLAAWPGDGSGPGLADPGTLAPLLVGFGRSLGERAAGSHAAPLLLALRHPDPRVRRGAQLGLDALLRRLFAGADAARAAGAILDLEALGLDRAQGSLLRARAALMLGSDPRVALEAARELVRSSPADGDRDARSARAIGRHLEAAALIAAGSSQAASAPVAEAASLLDGLLAERFDRGARSLAPQHSAWLHRRAQCELLEIVRTLGGAQAGPDLPQPEAAHGLAVASRAHALELEAQIADVSAHAPAEASLDPMLDDELSPIVLLLENPRLAAWPAARALAVRKAIGRLFASVARAEMPGFEPCVDVSPEVSDPLADPERSGLLRRILFARSDAVASELADLRARVHAEMAQNPALPSDEDAERVDVLWREWNDLQDAKQRAGQGDAHALLESRAPSLFGVSLARALREEGRAEESRALAEAVKSDLERTGDLKRYLLFEAEIEMAIGSTWIDVGDPTRAEVELVRAVERLEGIEAALKERGATSGDLAAIRGLRSTALVSLAVNANVKMEDKHKALAYFERAFELRQDEFMRVLLACYRARSGRGEEARAILREISPSPANLYNIACTWALLGEKDLALDCLRRDLEENPMSEGARAKQKEWARKDPDLSSLRGEARFRELVGE